MKNVKAGMIALSLYWLSGLTTTLFAEVKPATIFGSGMVIQQGIENAVWGWADKNEKVHVAINGKNAKTVTDKTGKWMVKLPPMEYGGPYTLTITGKNKIQFTNVMVGEVWLCSGQSNMEFSVSEALHADEEISNANYPSIRLFTVARRVAQEPAKDLDSGEWTVCSPATVSRFSAVGYFFGRKIHQELNVAVGLIHASWGGTVAESWTSPETIKQDPDFVDSWNELRRVDLANYEKSIKERINSVIAGCSNKDDGREQGFNQASYDDRNWKTIATPGLWEERGYRGINGVAWYRKSFTLDKKQSESDLVLSLGMIDDSDSCWVNGVEVGTTDRHNVDRFYRVPASVLKEGENVIALRITDIGGGGGLYSPARLICFKSGNTTTSLAGEWKLKFTEVTAETSALGPNDFPTLLYNGMINPIVPFGIKGTIWYQGESNADRAEQYRRVFPNLITDWRNHWGLGNFPFIWVQIANFTKAAERPAESTWAELREAQAMTLKLPATGMASAIDIGEADDIHPKNKQEAGRRLALNALKIAYGKELVHTGPCFESMTLQGSDVIITFNNTASGLKVNNKYGYINGFAIAGADGKFSWAQATLIDRKTIKLHSAEIKVPVAVRYGWADNPGDLNLYNSEDLPANPFRTDNWPGITK